MQNKRWTIGLVNFHTIDFIEYQLEIIHSNNQLSDFDLIIVDNSNESEEQALLELVKDYSSVRIIRNEASLEPWMRGSGQHGQGLDIILSATETEYLLVHDPDFFWVGNEYLKTLEVFLDKGCISVGAPYRNYNGHDETGGIGASDYPAAFGAAYNVEAIKELSFFPQVDKKSFEESNGSCWLAREGADVGWEIREHFSAEKYKSFFQKFDERLASLGSYSFEAVPYEYRVNSGDEPIAYHLFRGSFGEDVGAFIESGIITKSESLIDTRKAFGEYFLVLSRARREGGLNNKMHLLAFYFKRKIALQGNVMDFVLHHSIYSPLIKFVTLTGRMLTKLMLIIEKPLYVATHPVSFITSKFKAK